MGERAPEARTNPRRLLRAEPYDLLCTIAPELALDWIEKGLEASVGRKDLVSHTQRLATRIEARIDICLKQAGLKGSDIDAVFLTGGSVQLAHVRKAITSKLKAARAIDGDTFGAVGKGLTIEAIRRYGTP